VVFCLVFLGTNFTATRAFGAASKAAPVPSYFCSEAHAGRGEKASEAYRARYGFDGLKGHWVHPFLWRGQRMASQCFQGLEPGRGVVHVVHGYFDHAGLQAGMIRALVDAGFTVRTLDLPGHGLSAGAPAAISSMDAYQGVLELWLADQPEPLRVVAHSMGGAVVMEAMRRGSLSREAKVVLLAPLVRWSWWKTTGALAWLARGVVRTVPRRHRLSSGDPVYEKLRLSDPLQPKRVPLIWVRAMRAWSHGFVQAEPLDHRFVTVLQGTRDSTVDWRANQAILQRVFPRLRYHRLVGGRHHLQGDEPALRAKVFRMVVEGLERSEH
jgi:alpha-beta hydrolase superfamily lysophospholipase